MKELNSADVEVLKYNNELETIAKLVEAKAKTPEEAATIIRDCKSNTVLFLNYPHPKGWG